MSWGYDADIDHFIGSASRNSIDQHAANLLQDLYYQRQEDNLEDTPIIFVVHSLGGLVVKEALIQSAGTSSTNVKSIAPNTHAVLFLGTPHQGSSTASIGKYAYRVSRVYAKRPNTKLLSALELQSPDLKRIGDAFVQLVPKLNLKLSSFHEELETRKMIFISSVVVKPDSAKIGHPSEEHGSIPANHSGMTKFTSSGDLGYIRVSRVLQSWMRTLRSKENTGQSFREPFQYLQPIRSIA
ncbi:MAG: hypothetical protein M1828_001544 [Chrysothrix sp. TS-e1954]|nr:MAG: hypothetical protein M1828_001544 [Chrysothrix sp. TS-e1954]